MRSLLHHHASLEDGDPVGVPDGGEAVRHNDARPALAGLVQGVLHHLWMTDAGSRVELYAPNWAHK